MVVPLPPMLMLPLAPLDASQDNAHQAKFAASEGGVRVASMMPLFRTGSVHPSPADGGSSNPHLHAGDEQLGGRSLFLFDMSNAFRIFLAKVRGGAEEEWAKGDPPDRGAVQRLAKASLMLRQRNLNAVGLSPNLSSSNSMPVSFLTFSIQ